jgi:hypothetical protein
VTCRICEFEQTEWDFYSARVRVLAWERKLGCERMLRNGRAAASWNLPARIWSPAPPFPSRIQFQRSPSTLLPSLHSCLSKFSLLLQNSSQFFREFLLRFYIRVLCLSFDRLSFLQQAHGITRGRAPSRVTTHSPCNPQPWSRTLREHGLGSQSPFNPPHPSSL